MFDSTKEELQFIMLSEQYNSTRGQINVLNKTNKLLADADFCCDLKLMLDKYFRSDAVTVSDIGAVILSMQGLVIKFENVLNLYRGLDLEETKFILYGCLYYYLYKHKKDFLEKNLGELRLNFYNSFKLIEVSQKVFERDCMAHTRLWEWIREQFNCLFKYNKPKK